MVLITSQGSLSLPCLLAPLDVEQQAGAATDCCLRSLWVPWLQARLMEAGVAGAGAERIAAGHLGPEGLAGEAGEAAMTPGECCFPGFVQLSRVSGQNMRGRVAGPQVDRLSCSLCAGEGVWVALDLGVAYLQNTDQRLHDCTGHPWL